MTDVSAVRARIADGDVAALFPAGVQACVAEPGSPAGLTEAEAACVAGAGSGRRREYALGRAALKGALARLGAPAASIPSRPDRSPLLPPGYVGGLTHCEGFCAAAAARACDLEGLGLDAEPARPLAPDLAALVCGGPLDGPAGPPGLARALWPALVFCAKEAVYKCQHPLLAAPLDFGDLGVLFEDGTGSIGRFRPVFADAALPALRAWSFRGAWRLLDGLLLTAAWPDPSPR